MPTRLLFRTVLAVIVTFSGGCAARTASNVLIPQPAEQGGNEDVQRSVDTTFTKDETAFSIASTSKIGAELALPTLTATSDAFAALFGQRPPAIAVVVIDSMVPFRDVPGVRGGKATRSITLIGSGLAEDSTGAAGTRQSFRQTLAVLSAEAWVGTYANMWTSALVREEVILPPSMDSTDVPQLPDWLYAATIHLLANEHAVAQSTATLRAHPADIVTLDDLFSLRIPETSDDDLEEFLSDLSVGTMSRARFRAEVSPPRRETALFLAQATSVLQYLREVKGVELGSHLFGASLAGHDLKWIISESLGVSIGELDSEWRRWVLATPVVEML